jgi:hypothetical protein
LKGLIVKKAHFEQIRDGLKVETRRTHTRPLKPGNLAVLKKGYAWEWSPRVVVECSEEDARAEGFRDLAEFRDQWPRYSGVAWDPDLVVQVYEFRVET